MPPLIDSPVGACAVHHSSSGNVWCVRSTVSWDHMVSGCHSSGRSWTYEP